MGTRTKAVLRQLIDSKLQRATGTMPESDYDANLNLALDALRGKISFPETEKTATLVPALFRDVATYGCPADLFGNQIIDIRPLVQIPARPFPASWDMVTPVEFERNMISDRAPNKFTVEYNAALSNKTLKILVDILTGAKNFILDSCDTYNGNGTWIAAGDATNVHTDSANYIEGSGSVGFDIDVSLSVGDSATLYKPDMAVVSASGMNNPYLFYYVYLPDIAHITNLTFYIGSDASATPGTKANYYTFTATTAFNASLAAGYNLIGLPLSQAIKTGSPDMANLRYLELVVNYDSAQADMTGCLLDGVYLRDGVFYQLRYQTQYAVVANDGTKKQYFTSDDDKLVVNEEGEQLYVDFAAGYIAPNIMDQNAAAVNQNNARESIVDYTTKYPRSRRVFKKNWYYGGGIPDVVGTLEFFDTN